MVPEWKAVDAAAAVPTLRPGPFARAARTGRRLDDVKAVVWPRIERRGRAPLEVAAAADGRGARSQLEGTEVHTSENGSWAAGGVARGDRGAVRGRSRPP